MNDSPSFVNISCNFGMVLLPIPCIDKISFLLYLDKSVNVFIFSLSNARLAGATRLDRKLSLGFRSSSQIGQVEQSELL